MVALRKRIRSSGRYADQFKEALQPKSSRASIWSDQGSDTESAGEDESHQPGFSPEPDAGDISMTDGNGDQPNVRGVSQDVLASATADELALIGMAE